MDVVIYNGDGKAVSNKYTDSARGYAIRMLNKSANQSNTELLAVLVDMLNYGAAAQTIFGYNTEALVNADLTETQKGYATAEIDPKNEQIAGTGFKGTTLTLKNRILLDIVFDDAVIGTDFDGMYAIAEFTDHYGRAKTERIETISEYSEGFHYVSVSTLVVADCGQLVSVKLYNSDGEVIGSASDSINGYVARQIAKGETDDIYVAIAKFGASAYNFFH